MIGSATAGHFESTKTCSWKGAHIEDVLYYFEDSRIYNHADQCCSSIGRVRARAIQHPVLPRCAAHHTTGAVFLVACAFLPLSEVLVSSLENRFPVQRGDILPPAGIIVLGGATDENVEAARGQVTLTDAGERLITGAITGAEARKKTSASENASDRLLIAPCCLRSGGSGPWKPAN